MRVSTANPPNPFELDGAEIIYVSFEGAFNRSDFLHGIQSAVLTVQSVDGGFDLNAGLDRPFVVTAHGVDLDPLSSITDDTNPDGPIDWLDFANDHILPPSHAARTLVQGFGTYTFDVTDLIKDWTSGANTNFTIALTGKNDISGMDFLQGFSNNSETPGSTFLTIVPLTDATAFVGPTFWDAGDDNTTYQEWDTLTANTGNLPDNRG